MNDAKVLAHLDYFRATKTPYEIHCMRAAQVMAVRGHQAVAAAFRPGVSEFELHQIYCTAAQQRETELPYSSIVALNEHASTLHYQNLRTACAVAATLAPDRRGSGTTTATPLTSRARTRRRAATTSTR